MKRTIEVCIRVENPNDCQLAHFTRFSLANLFEDVISKAISNEPLLEQGEITILSTKTYEETVPTNVGSNS